ncbi:hypothetical protein AAT19DRAFT_14688 [Rhodotorula toruloides]|uniref:Uncharacterized protein n=1 Tax=Rhodotorula toruloides TaxID=5286 RepID=A0A2T0A8K0_RHOTO|nr:hypothetical protein AAT19DRAFT_14688 [Rhodotorula toruloides]
MGWAGRLPDCWVWHGGWVGVGRVRCGRGEPRLWDGLTCVVWLLLVCVLVVQADIAVDAWMPECEVSEAARATRRRVQRRVPGMVHFDTRASNCALSSTCSLLLAVVQPGTRWDWLTWTAHTRTPRPHLLAPRNIHPRGRPSTQFPPPPALPRRPRASPACFAPLFPLVSPRSLTSRCPPHSQPASQAVHTLARLALRRHLSEQRYLAYLAHRVQLHRAAAARSTPGRTSLRTRIQPMPSAATSSIQPFPLPAHEFSPPPCSLNLSVNRARYDWTRLTART